MPTERDAAETIDVRADGQIQIREATYEVDEDGVAGVPSYHRYVLAPGDDLAGKDERIVQAAKEAWTPAIVAAWRARMAQA